VQKIARTFGSLVVVCVTGNDPALELENIDSLCRRVDGILIAPSHSSNTILNEKLAGLGIPVISFDQPLSGVDIQGVVTDNYQSAKDMTRHLLQHGYGRTNTRIRCSHAGGRPDAGDRYSTAHPQ
jgi:DNA-binding LacI/PurR family transcriptional regulator